MNRPSEVSKEGNALLADLERFRPPDLTMNGWAVAAGVSRAIWGDIKRHGNPSRKTLEKLLAAVGSSLAEFEALRIGSTLPEGEAAPGVLSDSHGLWRPASPLFKPAIQTVSNSEIQLGKTAVPFFVLTDVGAESPLEHARDSLFEIRVCVSNMEPRFRVGRTIMVDRRAEYGAGDDVMIGLRQTKNQGPGRSTLLAHLVDQTEFTLRLRQYSPTEDFELPRADAEGIYKILGEVF